MADAMAERGTAGATVSAADVIARAGVSRGVFRELFADREACLLAAFELGVVCEAFGLERRQSLEGPETRKLRAAALTTRLIFDPAIRGRTDQFILKFVRP